MTRLWQERVYVIDEFVAGKGLFVRQLYDKKRAVIDAIMGRKGVSDGQNCGEKGFV